ncbi:MAG: hypothetical protein RL272_1139 [Candidatus Parcubacteria bacterium]|jgi:hypothetical protein
MNLTSENFKNIVRFYVRSVDGNGSEVWCIDGVIHAEHQDDLIFGASTRVIGPCDGSCLEARDDLRDLFARLRGSFQTSSGKIVHDPVSIDDGFGRLLSGPGALVGLRFKDGYCKRDSTWRCLCLERRTHVEFSTNYDWADDPEKGCSHDVRTSPCDGSCRESVVADRKAILQILRDLARAER